MAEILKAYDFPSPGKRRFKDEWYDGRIWRLTDRDLGSDPHKKVMSLKAKGYRLGMRLDISTEEEGVVILQATPADGEQLEVSTGKTSRKSSKKNGKKSGKKNGKSKKNGKRG